MTVIKKGGPTSLVRRCNRHGCQKLVHGFLRMNLPAVGDPDRKLPPLCMPVPLFLCADHAAEASARDFMTVEWQDEVLRVLKARGAHAEPDFKNAWLDIVPFEQATTDVVEGEAHGR